MFIHFLSNMPLAGSSLFLYRFFLLHLQQKICKSGPGFKRKSKNYLQLNLKKYWGPVEL